MTEVYAFLANSHLLLCSFDIFLPFNEEDELDDELLELDEDDEELNE